MSSAANPQHRQAPPYHRERRRRDMSGQHGGRYTDGYQDTLFDRIVRLLQPQLQDIKDQLDDLVTRREHDKDLAEITTDMSAHQRQLDRLQDWADKRPRESADVSRVTRIEADVAAINTQLKAQPSETRATLNTIFSGGGCLYMVLGFAAMIIFQLLTIGVSVALTLALR